MRPVGPRVSRDLADYHAVIAADIKDFTSNTDTGNWRLARKLPEVLAEAFARSHLDFSRLEFPGQAGDGYAAGIDYHKLPYLIDPLLDHLQDVLAEVDAELRAHDRGLRMRLRTSIHVGPLPGKDDPDRPAGIGRAMNELHRQLDADPIRSALQRTDPDTTFVAAVISHRAYEDAIQSEACKLQRSRLTAIPIHVKQFTSTAWLYVPEPSGEALHSAFARSDADSRATRSVASPFTADQEHASAMAASGTTAPIFHIGSAGQVAGTVAAPVTIHQVIADSADLAARQGTDTHAHSPSREARS